MSDEEREAQDDGAHTPGVMPEGEGIATVDEIVVWFDVWLKEPITKRERVIISETINHAMKYPGDVHRANANAMSARHRDASANGREAAAALEAHRSLSLDERIERAAQAICRNRCCPGEDWRAFWCDGELRRFMQQDAIAVLTAEGVDESANARQIEGWALDQMVYTKGKMTLAWGFFESRGAAEQEAQRLGVGVVPSTLILPVGGSQ